MVTSTATELIGRREAARRAGVHVNTIRLWERTGRLTPYKQENGNVLIDPTELETIVTDRHDGSDEEKLRIRAATLEAENRLLREQLEEERHRNEKLLHTIIELASGERTMLASGQVKQG